MENTYESKITILNITFLEVIGCTTENYIIEDNYKIVVDNM